MQVDYLQRQQDLHLIAQQILQKLDLLTFLRKFGEVHTVGSYELQLMSWEDIDIVVLQKMTPRYEDFLETIQYIFPKEEVYSLHLQDFRKSIHPDRPQGIYCEVKYQIKPDILWKIDIWFFASNNKAVENVEMIKSKLNDQNRKIILEIKNRMREEFPHGKEISGIDVYTAVLDNKVSTLEEFKLYIEKLGREV
jgi:hypothetical protein